MMLATLIQEGPDWPSLWQLQVCKIGNWLNFWQAYTDILHRNGFIVIFKIFKISSPAVLILEEDSLFPVKMSHSFSSASQHPWCTCNRGILVQRWWEGLPACLPIRRTWIVFCCFFKCQYLFMTSNMVCQLQSQNKWRRSIIRGILIPNTSE